MSDQMAKAGAVGHTKSHTFKDLSVPGAEVQYI